MFLIKNIAVCILTQELEILVMCLNTVGSKALLHPKAGVLNLFKHVAQLGSGPTDCTTFPLCHYVAEQK